MSKDEEYVNELKKIFTESGYTAKEMSEHGHKLWERFNPKFDPDKFNWNYESSLKSSASKFRESTEKFQEEFYKLPVVWFLVAYLAIISIYSIYSDYESTQELKKLKIENQLLIKQLNGKDSTLERHIGDYPRTR